MPLVAIGGGSVLQLLSQCGLRLCDRVTRRGALQVGGLATLGLTLPQLLQARALGASTAGRGPTFGRAKRVLLLFMWGGPAHQDTWDLKPEGPVETRGEFRPIGTNVSGIHICEHFPRIARHADKLALIRSVSQDDNNHSTGAHAGLTGRRHTVKAENFGASDSDFPHYGSVLSKLRPNRDGLPTFVALPDIIATTAGAVTPGQGGGLLGRKYDPFRITDHPDRPDFNISTLRLPDGVTIGQMRHRRDLLGQIEQVARVADRSPLVRSMDSFYQQALDMVLSREARRAFDLSSVAEDKRWRYGFHTFGQSVLLAKRLIEAGVQLVTVYWHREKASVDSSWDTHGDNFTELKHRLMPAVDRPIAALLEDLAASGLLEETLIVWNSEFGRTPRINANAGRDHWGPCNSVVMAGGGVPGGQVFGETDAQAAYPTRDPVTQDDIAATIYHLLGIAPETLIHDPLGRPLAVALGEPIHKLLDGESRPHPSPAPPPITDAPHYGPFTRMLIERCRRHLTCDLGNPESERDWELAGWSAPQSPRIAIRGLDGNSYRAVAKETATLRYRLHYPSHMHYAWLAFRLAEPRSLGGVSIRLSGREVPIAAKLKEAAPRQLWQLPLPEGLSLRELSLELTAPGWPLTDFAILGDPIEEWHSQRVI